MTRTEAKSRIVAITVGRIEVSLGATGEMSMKVASALQDVDGNVHGRTEFVGPWSAKVTNLISDLQKAAEEYLLTVHFEVERDGDTGAATSRTTDRPQGLFGIRLGDPGAEADQL